MRKRMYVSASDALAHAQRVIPNEDMRVSDEAPDRGAAADALAEHFKRLAQEKLDADANRRAALDVQPSQAWLDHKRAMEAFAVAEERFRRLVDGTERSVRGGLVLKSAEQLAKDRRAARELANHHYHGPVGTMVPMDMGGMMSASLAAHSSRSFRTEGYYR